MKAEEVKQYIEKSFSRFPLDRYVERRFTAAEEAGALPVDTDVRFRGMLRDREPKLGDILKHPRVVILAEPGGGKSVIARAALRQFASDQGRAPIFAELKEYRGDLTALITSAAQPAVLDPSTPIDGRPILRAYVLDGIDEIPKGTLPQLGVDLQHLFDNDPSASVLLTARQAFYAAHRDSLPVITSLFHILDFSDKDIAEYVTKSNVDLNAFLAAVRNADASEEIRNPFILSVMIEKYRTAGSLSDRRSDNMSYMIDRLILSRPQVNRHRQHRALKMLGAALETYSRNELTEQEAFAIIKTSMRISDAEVHAILDELYASILKRTANGLAFQMRSYGEYLAAEELENAPLERVKELAFLDTNTPNETWLNAASYLIELNPQVRAYFVRRCPLWAISSSPAAFSDEEKATIVTSVLQTCTREKQYIVHHPLINTRRLSRFITEAVETALRASVADPNEVVRGNAIVLLGLREKSEVLPAALDAAKDKSLGVEIRYCAVVALVNVARPRNVPELLDALDRNDPLHINFLDMIAAIIDEAQIHTVLPLILRENAMLSAAYYHFREFTSREALVQTLRYFIERPNDLNTIRAESYVEPVFELLPRYFDAGLAELCADILETIERLRIYPDQSGPMPKLFISMRDADREGLIARVFFARVLQRQGDRKRIYYVDQLVVSLMTRESARWLIEQDATDLIHELAPYLSGEIRDLLRPYSGGLIDAQDANTSAYLAERSQQEEARIRHIGGLQESLLVRTSLNDALKDLYELKEDYWPELPDAYRTWLAAEISKLLGALDLEKNIHWKEQTLSQPGVLPFLLKIIDRYSLKIDPDEPLILAVTGWDTDVVARYHKCFQLSGAALKTLERLLKTPASDSALEQLVRFIDSSEIWSVEILESLEGIASSGKDYGYLQVTALNILAKHGVESGFIEGILNEGAGPDLRRRAFEILVEGQHRPTIERALATLSDDDLRAGNARIPDMSPLGWIVNIKSDFAWDKLVALRGRALRLELPMLVGLITETLAKVDRAGTAVIIRRQVDLAPQGWRVAQIAQALEQERTAKIEAAQLTPFEDVLRRLRGSTSINRLKVLCEGTTDRPVFKSLIDQVGTAPGVILDSVGGWGGLAAEADPNIWLLGCKEAVMVLDGDEGRHLTKHGRPYTKRAKEERKKLSGFPIDFRVLERYGIENYFPQTVFEKIVGIDLSAYFPLRDDISAIEQLSKSRASWSYKLRKWVAKMFGLAQPSPKEPLYSKGRNFEVALSLDLQDLTGTDLYNVVHDICETAKRMADE